MSNTSLLGSYGGQAGDGILFRNRIVNGCMRIDQRNAGAAVTPANATYTLDRWGAFQFANSGKFSVQQTTDVPVGFRNSLAVTSLSAYSMGANDTYSIYQCIEGLNVADLAFGTASAQSVTISFWVKSSLTGTFGGALQNSAANRSCPFSYSISAANTWEYKTVTLAGDTSGTWLTDNGTGIRLVFSVGSGTSASGTAGTWSGSTLYSATGATSVVGTNGATFRITGVSFEAGPTATPFERRPIQTELALAQRYYQRITPAGAAIGFCIGYCEGIAGANGFVAFKTTMRAAPQTIETTGVASDYMVRISGSNVTCTAIPGIINSSTDGCNVGFTATVVAGQGARLQTSAATTGFLGFSAEL